MFTQLVETSRPFVREASMVPVYGLLAFGGQLEVLHDQGLLLLDGWAKFKAPARVSERVGRPAARDLAGGAGVCLRVSLCFKIGRWAVACLCVC